MISPGIINNDAGPDFSNAKIRIDGITFAGNVEVHVKASDWYRHGHDKDDAYNSVILHVVAIDDTRISRPDGSEIPQICIGASDNLMQTFISIMSTDKKIRCSDIISSLPEISISEWTDTLIMERMWKKTDSITSMLDNFRGDWEQICFILTARSLGFGLNGPQFELLAKNSDLKIISRHSDNPMQIEAFLFGQAGMLNPAERILDPYYQLLCSEYRFMATKYKLRPADIKWRYARTRPANFPHRRIALLASYCLGGFRMFRKIIEAEGEIERLKTIFIADLSDFWKKHFSFNTESEIPSNRFSSLSSESLDILIINTVVPIYFAYGNFTGNDFWKDLAIDTLYRMPPEKNHIIRNWKETGLKCLSARDSQALLHLHKEYCSSSGCHKCRWGYAKVKSTIMNCLQSK